MQALFLAIEMFDEGFDAAFVMHFDRRFLDAALVHQDDGDAGIEERELAQPVFQRLDVEVDVGERVERRQEGDFGAMLARIGDSGERCLGFAVDVALVVLLALAADAQIEPR